MSDNEMNLAVARACQAEFIDVRDEYQWPASANKLVVYFDASGKLIIWGHGLFDPRNDDAQAIAALERCASEASLDRIRDAMGKNGWMCTIIAPVSAQSEVVPKLSHAITDAILAAQEKRNA